MPDPLKYAHVERERRFLVTAVPEGVQESVSILDRYVEGTRLRLREVRHADGTLLAELDLGPGTRRVDLPGWLDIIAEVSDDEAWTGAALARPGE